MFTVLARDALLERLVERAQASALIETCAQLGSAARGDGDEWSDIDLALETIDGVDVDEVVDDWTRWMRGAVSVADTFDVRWERGLYRVFLTADALQVDLSFWPAGAFVVRGGPVRVLKGEPQAHVAEDPPDVHAAVRRGWLAALHARAALGRTRAWQAELMLAELREQVVALACAAEGLLAAQGREVDRLDPTFLERLAASRSTGLGLTDLRRSFAATVQLYLEQVAGVDAELGARLDAPLRNV